MKKSDRMPRLKKMLWPFLLSAAIIIESTVGSVGVYAEESTDSGDPSSIAADRTEDSETEETKKVNSKEDNVDDEEQEGEDKKDNSGQDEDDEDDSGDSEDEGEDSEETDEETEETGGDETEEEESSEEETDEAHDGVLIEEESVEESKEDDSELLQRARELFGEDFSQDDLDDLIELLNTSSEEWAEKNGYAANGHFDTGLEVEGIDGSAPRTIAALPSKYDSRDRGIITPVRNQGEWETCWSFAVMAVAESNYIRKFGGSNINFSETQLVNFTYNGNYSDRSQLVGPDGGLAGDYTTVVSTEPNLFGGNGMFATLAMAGWTGIADEATDKSLKYPDVPDEKETLPYIAPGYAYHDVLHLENAYWIPTADKNDVKRAIMEYGATTIGYHADYTHDSSRVGTVGNVSFPAVQYYSINETPAAANHDVTIVGWDDNFSKNNFRYTLDNVSRNMRNEGYLLPENDGAWLIKNSWGTDVLDAGYFWMSYEDATMDANTYTYDFARANNYDHNYQYDGTVELEAQSSIDGDEITAAAVYTAKSEEQIAAVGVVLWSSSTDYEIKIYKGLTDENNPESGTLAGESNGRTSYAGYYTIKLDAPVHVEKGETFGVVVTAGKEGGASLMIDKSEDLGGIVTHASTENDRTYYKKGSSWYDAGAEGMTFRIKAFTNNVKHPSGYDDDDDDDDDEPYEPEPPAFMEETERPADPEEWTFTGNTKLIPDPAESVQQDEPPAENVRRGTNSAAAVVAPLPSIEEWINIPAETTSQQDTEQDTAIRYVQAELKYGRIAAAEGVIATETMKTALSATTIVTVGDGFVSVTVDSEKYQYPVGVADTIALINAVLTPEQMQLVNSGEKIEIRVEAKDISDQVSNEDKDIIENGLASYETAEEAYGELTIGAYIDISIYIRIGDGDWDAVTQAGEPVEIAIGIPDNLQSGDRVYYAARSHEGAFALLDDCDSVADTITIETEMFSAYAIVFRQMNAAGANGSSGFPASLSWTAAALWSLGILILLGIAIFLIVGKRRKDGSEE